MTRTTVIQAALFGALVIAGGSANAAVVNITFDETTAAGSLLNTNDVVTTQYADLGVTFGGDDPFVVKTGADFNNAFPSDGNLIHLNGSNPQAATISLTTLADFLSFDFRRPQNAGDIFVSLFNDTVEVLAATTLNWTPGAVGNDALTDFASFSFTAADAGSLFNRIELSSSNKFVLDNLALNTITPGQPVPVPAPFLLLASGLIGLCAKRRVA